MRYRFRCEYLGSAFFGWQEQNEASKTKFVTVQSTLEAAFAAALRSPVRLVGSGRTDTGVHARRQVSISTGTGAFRLRQGDVFRERTYAQGHPHPRAGTLCAGLHAGTMPSTATISILFHPARGALARIWLGMRLARNLNLDAMGARRGFPSASMIHPFLHSAERQQDDSLQSHGVQTRTGERLTCVWYIRGNRFLQPPGAGDGRNAL